MSNQMSGPIVFRALDWFLLYTLSGKGLVGETLGHVVNHRSRQGSVAYCTLPRSGTLFLLSVFSYFFFYFEVAQFYFFINIGSTYFELLCVRTAAEHKDISSPHPCPPRNI